MAVDNVAVDAALLSVAMTAEGSDVSTVAAYCTCTPVVRRRVSSTTDLTWTLVMAADRDRTAAAKPASLPVNTLRGTPAIAIVDSSINCGVVVAVVVREVVVVVVVVVAVGVEAPGAVVSVEAVEAPRAVEAVVAVVEASGVVEAVEAPGAVVSVEAVEAPRAVEAVEAPGAVVAVVAVVEAPDAVNAVEAPRAEVVVEAVEAPLFCVVPVATPVVVVVVELEQYVHGSWVTGAARRPRGAVGTDPMLQSGTQTPPLVSTVS